MGEQQHDGQAHRAYGQMLAEVAALVARIEDEGAGKPGDPLLAVCLDCQPMLPMPFADAEQRSEWVEAHRGGARHRVVLPDLLSESLKRLAAQRRWGSE